MSKRGYLSPRQHAAIPLQELIRLRRWLEKYGVEIEAKDWLFVLCHTLAPLREREGGLDFYHLHASAAAAGLISSEDEALAMIHKVCDYRAAHPTFRNLSRKTVGKILDLVPVARRDCRITTMDAIGETKEQRKELRASEGRKRKERERRAAGKVPRAEWEAAALTRTKPWEADGVCRRTWERRRKRDVAGVARHILTLSTADTLATTAPPSDAATMSGASATGQVPSQGLTLLTPTLKQQQQKSKISERSCRATTASELRKAA